ncbi:hypothetical protein VTN00DRAFT_7274 [Thermoascus crustaceus]|uniref:uncharacterized protein n=1 Tax=Thermoascus crustaceus TaxID=5088 RepID=UPI003742A0A3
MRVRRVHSVDGDSFQWMSSEMGDPGATDTEGLYWPYRRPGPTRTAELSITSSPRYLLQRTISDPAFASGELDGVPSWPVAGTWTLDNRPSRITSIGTEQHHAVAHRRGRTEGLGRRRSDCGKHRRSGVSSSRAQWIPISHGICRRQKIPGPLGLQSLQPGSSRFRWLPATLHAASQHLTAQSSRSMSGGDVYWSWAGVSELCVAVLDAAPRRRRHEIAIRPHSLAFFVSSTRLSSYA